LHEPSNELRQLRYIPPAVNSKQAAGTENDCRSALAIPAIPCFIFRQNTVADLDHPLTNSVMIATNFVIFTPVPCFTDCLPA
jgi:hypothetical protein